MLPGVLAGGTSLDTSLAVLGVVTPYVSPCKMGSTTLGDAPAAADEQGLHLLSCCFQQRSSANPQRECHACVYCHTRGMPAVVQHSCYHKECHEQFAWSIADVSAMCMCHAVHRLRSELSLQDQCWSKMGKRLTSTGATCHVLA